MQKILVVDLCDTLYTSNTTQDFFNYTFANDEVYLKLKNKNKSFSFKVMNKLSNKVFKYDLSRALTTKILRDKESSKIDELVSKFLEGFLESKKINKVHEIIEEYKKNGYKIIMVSASYDFIGKCVAKKIGIDDVIASRAEVLDNKYTGRVAEDILHTKLSKFKEKFPSYEDLVMITDNTTDYEFVKETSKSYIVINKRNEEFWRSRKEDKFIFVEE